MAQTLEHNQVVTQVVPITVPSCDVDVTVIQQLDDEPNDVGGLTAAELKAKFDETNAAVKSYINDELIPSVVGADATEQARAAAEAERVANEIERVSNETTRVNAETTRGNNETSRQGAETTRGNNETSRQGAEITRGNNETTRESNETIRQNNEAARVLAEAARENAETGYVAQCATSAQDAANSATAASNSATAAGNSAMNAATSESNAAASEAAASESETAAGNSATAAGNSAKNAATSERNAEASAEDAEAWAVGKRGGVNVGEGDPAYHNNALYWKEQAQKAAGAGDMLAATYDPQGKEQDIFAYIDNAISGVTVTTDETPTQGSTNPVQSGGVYTALANKLDKTGDGSNITAAFTAASSRANIATGEKLSVLFGKIAKWFSDLGSLAFKSTVAKTDLASDVQTSLGKADSALQSVTKSDVGLGNVDNVKQYSSSNPPPYPVTSVNGQTGDVEVQSGGTESTSQTVTLTTSGWAQSGNRYSQTVNVTGVTASTPVVLVDVALSGADIDADAAALEAWGIVSANNVAQGNGTLTFYALSVPSVNVPVNVGVC